MMGPGCAVQTRAGSISQGKRLPAVHCNMQLVLSKTAGCLTLHLSARLHFN